MGNVEGNAIESLTFEQTLSALQEMLGEKVWVEIHLRLESKARPLAAFSGILRGADEPAPESPWPSSGDPLVFYVGDDDANGRFVMDSSDFKHGRRRGRFLAFEAGRARFLIGPFDLADDEARITFD